MQTVQLLLGEKGERLASPLSHSQMRMLAHLKEVVCDAAPHDVETGEVDQSGLEELGHGKQTRLSICGRKVHAFFAQFAGKKRSLPSTENLSKASVLINLPESTYQMVHGPLA